MCEIPIFTTFNGGFGDCWAVANYLLRLSERGNKPTLVWELDERIRTIIPVLRSTGSILQSTKLADHLIFSSDQESRFRAKYGFFPEHILGWKVCFAERYLETTKVWVPNRSGRICYQLVPRHYGPTTCAEGHIHLFCETATSLGYELIALGAHFTLEQNIRLASECELFVGVDSGISHLCHSVGVPVHLIRNGITDQHLSTTHRGNLFFRYSDIPEFLRALRSRDKFQRISSDSDDRQD